jgi:hypothetical protein
LWPDDPIIAVTKILPRGAVQLPPAARGRLGLKPGNEDVARADDALVMKKAGHDTVPV